MAGRRITRRLTSVVVDEIATGQQAVSLLHEMRRGKRPSTTTRSSCCDWTCTKAKRWLRGRAEGERK